MNDSHSDTAEENAPTWWQDDLTNKYSGLIFDCDGTLTDSMPLHYIAWRDTMQGVGVAFPEDRFYAMGGMPTDSIIATLCGECGIEVDIAGTGAKKEAAFAALVDQLKPLEVVCSVARRHRGQIPMAVASGGLRPSIDEQLIRIDMADWFDAIVTSEDTQRHKPEPDVFLLAAERLGVDPERCLVFEDSPLGIEAAKRAGMDCVDIRPFV